MSKALDVSRRSLSVPVSSRTRSGVLRSKLNMEFSRLTSPEIFQRIADEIVALFEGYDEEVTIDVAEPGVVAPLANELRMRGYTEADIHEIVGLLIWRSGFKPRQKEITINLRKGNAFLGAQKGRWPTIYTDPAWRRFEKLVAVFHSLRMRSSGIRVQHDITLKGKSGAGHQIDVLLEVNTGPYRLRIIISCKRFGTQNVKKSDVAELVSIRGDLGVDRAAIVSATGFQAGAKKYGEHHDVDLWKLDEIGGEDWEEKGAARDIPIPIPHLEDAEWDIDPDSWNVTRPARPFLFTEVVLEDRQGRHSSLAEFSFWAMFRLALLRDAPTQGVVLGCNRRAHVPRLGVSFFLRRVSFTFSVQRVRGGVVREEPSAKNYVMSHQTAHVTLKASEREILPLLLTGRISPQPSEK